MSDSGLFLAARLWHGTTTTTITATTTTGVVAVVVTWPTGATHPTAGRRPLSQIIAQSCHASRGETFGGQGMVRQAMSIGGRQFADQVLKTRRSRNGGRRQGLLGRSRRWDKGIHDHGVTGKTDYQHHEQQKEVLEARHGRQCVIALMMLLMLLMLLLLRMMVRSCRCVGWQDQGYRQRDKRLKCQYDEKWGQSSKGHRRCNSSHGTTKTPNNRWTKRGTNNHTPARAGTMIERV